MSHPAQRRIKKRKKTSQRSAQTQATPKAQNDFIATERPNRNGAVRRGRVGTTAIDAITKWAVSLKPYELAYPQNITTFHEMYSRDEDVGGVLNATYTIVERAFADYKVLGNNSRDHRFCYTSIHNCW